MAATPEELLAELDRLGIAYRSFEHPAVFTVAQSAALRGSLPGGHCKSLFFRDRKGGLWLAVMLEDRRLDLKALSDRVGAPRFSFGGAELLVEALGVAPGSVTPFALINDRGHRVRVVLDSEMLRCEILNYHPLVNTRTIAVAPQDLLKFIAHCGHEPLILDLGGLDRALC